MQVFDGEPPFAPWRVRRIDDVLRELLPGPTGDRPALVAVDGRSGNGKTTVTARLAARVPGAAVVHTDGGGSAEEAFWQEWEAAERPFLTAERPWERADVVVAGDADRPYDPATELVVADRPAPVRGRGPSR